jgi:hypothetical protein
MDPRSEKHSVSLTLQHKIQQSVSNRLGRCYKRSGHRGMRFYVISAFAAMIWSCIPGFAICLNYLRHNACFHWGTQSFRLLRKGSQFLLLARGVSDGDFGGMVALPLAIRQSQCGIGTSGTPIFFARSAFFGHEPSCTFVLPPAAHRTHRGHEDRASLNLIFVILWNRFQI